MMGRSTGDAFVVPLALGIAIAEAAAHGARDRRWRSGERML